MKHNLIYEIITLYEVFNCPDQSLWSYFSSMKYASVCRMHFGLTDALERAECLRTIALFCALSLNIGFIE